MIMHTRLSGCLTLAAEFNMQRLTPSIHSMLLSGIKRAPQLDGRRMAEHRASRNVLSASASVSRGANRKCVDWDSHRIQGRYMRAVRLQDGL